MLPSHDGVYRAEPSDQLVSVALGAIDALYHRRSGATHLVAAPVPQILALLAETPADLASLWDRLSARFDLDDADGDGRQALQDRLTELVSLGLVRCERAPPG